MKNYLKIAMLSLVIIFTGCTSTQSTVDKTETPVQEQTTFTEQQHSTAQAVAFGYICVELYTYEGKVFERTVMEAALEMLSFPTTIEERDIVIHYINTLPTKLTIDTLRTECDSVVNRMIQGV